MHYRYCVWYTPYRLPPHLKQPRTSASRMCCCVCAQKNTLKLPVKFPVKFPVKSTPPTYWFLPMECTNGTTHLNSTHLLNPHSISTPYLLRFSMHLLYLHIPIPSSVCPFYSPSGPYPVRSVLHCQTRCCHCQRWFHLSSHGLLVCHNVIRMGYSCVTIVFLMSCYSHIITYFLLLPCLSPYHHIRITAHYFSTHFPSR